MRGIHGTNKWGSDSGQAWDIHGGERIGVAWNWNWSAIYSHSRGIGRTVGDSGGAFFVAAKIGNVPTMYVVGRRDHQEQDCTPEERVALIGGGIPHGLIARLSAAADVVM